MEVYKVMDRWGTSETIRFDLSDDALEYRDTILNCEKVFTIYYGAELVVWQLDSMVWEMEDAVADQANLEVFAELPDTKLCCLMFSGSKGHTRVNLDQELVLIFFF